MQDLYLCLDCGLTNTKIVLFDEVGNSRGLERFETPLEGVQINVSLFFEKIVAGIRSIVEKCGNEKIKSIIVSGHGNGCYFLEKSGKISMGISSMITDTLPITSQEVWELTGQNSWSGQPLAIMRWMKKTNKAFLDRTKYILSCKDSIRYLMTGEVATDYSDASAAGLLDRITGEYSMKLLSIYDLEEYADRLPPILNYMEISGMSQKFAQRTGLKTGLPVLNGLFDVNACLLGSGVIVPGSYLVIAGTWGIHAALTEKPVYHPSITQTCCFVPKEEKLCIDSAPTSFANIGWFMKQEGTVGIEQRNRIVEESVGNPDILFFPYCYQPTDLEKVQAGYIGLKPEHTYQDKLRAVYEGIAFEHARRVDKLKQIGIYGNKIVLSGGGARSSVFAQMLTDITGMRVETSKEEETGALGGAILSAVVLGRYNGIQEAVENMVQKDSLYEPQNSTYYKNKYEYFLCEVNKRKREEVR